MSESASRSTVLSFDIGSVNLATCETTLTSDGKLAIGDWRVESAAEGSTVSERVRKLVDWFHKKDWRHITHFVIEQQNANSPTNYALHYVLYALLIRRYPRAETQMQQAHLKYTTFGVQLRGLNWRQRKNMSVTLAKAILESILMESADAGKQGLKVLSDSKKKDDLADSLLLACVHLCTLKLVEKSLLTTLFTTPPQIEHAGVTVMNTKTVRKRRVRTWQLADSVEDDITPGV
jgi:hypothetical protein